MSSASKSSPDGGKVGVLPSSEGRDRRPPPPLAPSQPTATGRDGGADPPASAPAEAEEGCVDGRRRRRRRRLRPRPSDGEGRRPAPSSSPSPSFSPSSPPSPPSASSSSSSSRGAILACLLMVAAAIAHAVSSGFERMHRSKAGDAERWRQGQHQGHRHEQLRQQQDQQQQQRQQPPQFNGGDLERSRRDEDEVDGGSIDDGASATILSRASQLSSLVSHLDASDVVEVYVVTRTARLASASLPGSGGRDSNGRGLQGESQQGLQGGPERRTEETATKWDSESRGLKGIVSAESSASSDEGEAKAAPSSATSGASSGVPAGPVLIRKSALAFRYRPSAIVVEEDPTPAERAQRKKYFELTLEYGPQRAGAARTSESVPAVRVDPELAGTGSEGGGHDDDESATLGKYVSWENAGRIYHATRIDPALWTEAYYMASVTGVVLEKILQRAVEYTYRRPRYQPFEVVSVPSGRRVLRSSGSDDFVWDMFRDLADLYVDIDPLLVPPRGRVQFYVSDPPSEEHEEGGEGIGEEGSGGGGDASSPRRTQINPNVRRVQGPKEGARAAAFYEKFLRCADAIRTGDYSRYAPPATPSPSAGPTAGPTGSNAPSMMSSVAGEADGGNGTEAGDEGEGTAAEEADAVGGTDGDDSSDADVDGDSEAPDDGVVLDGGRRLRRAADVSSGRRRRLDEEDVDGDLDEAAPGEEGSVSPETDAAEERDEVVDLEENADADADTDADIDVDVDAEEDDEPSDEAPETEDAEETEESADDPAEAAEKAAIEAAKAAENAAAAAATNSGASNSTSAVSAFCTSSLSH
ncbi:hypothetical protein ACHAWF_012631 [Thalassiosira exigua]